MMLLYLCCFFLVLTNQYKCLQGSIIPRTEEGLSPTSDWSAPMKEQDRPRVRKNTVTPENEVLTITGDEGSVDTRETVPTLQARGLFGKITETFRSTKHSDNNYSFSDTESNSSYKTAVSSTKQVASSDYKSKVSGGRGLNTKNKEVRYGEPPKLKILETNWETSSDSSSKYSDASSTKRKYYKNMGAVSGHVTPRPPSGSPKYQVQGIWRKEKEVKAAHIPEVQSETHFVCENPAEKINDWLNELCPHEVHQHGTKCPRVSGPSSNVPFWTRRGNQKENQKRNQKKRLTDAEWQELAKKSLEDKLRDWTHEFCSSGSVARECLNKPIGKMRKSPQDILLETVQAWKDEFCIEGDVLPVDQILKSLSRLSSKGGKDYRDIKLTIHKWKRENGA